MIVDLELGVMGLTMIHEVYARSTVARIQEEWRQFKQSDQETSVRVIGPGLSSCGAICLNDGNAVRVFIGGATSPTLFANVAAGYMYPVEQYRSFPFNGAFVRDAQRIIRDGIAGLAGENASILLFGHSAGGAVAEAILALLVRESSFISQGIQTYGAPAAAWSGAYATPDNGSRARFMTTDDPVPLIPWTTDPHLGSTWFVDIASASLLGGGLNPQPQRFIQPGQGVRLGNRHVVDGQMPRLTRAPAAILRDFLQARPGQNTAHSADNYLLEMRAAMRERGAVTDTTATQQQLQQERHQAIVVDVPNPPPPAATDVPLAMVEIRPDSIALDTYGRTIGQVAVTEDPMSFVKLNPKKAFRKVKVGEQWQVCIGERVVMVADIPRVPSTIVKRLNGMLKAIGTTNTVWLAEFLAGLEDWFTHAASDEEYCRPPLHVDL